MLCMFHARVYIYVHIHIIHLSYLHFRQIYGMGRYTSINRSILTYIDSPSFCAGCRLELSQTRLLLYILHIIHL
jgi:hypothetical protein